MNKLLQQQPALVKHLCATLCGSLGRLLFFVSVLFQLVPPKLVYLGVFWLGEGATKPSGCRLNELGVTEITEDWVESRRLTEHSK